MHLSSLDNCWRTIAALRAALAETTGVFLCGCPPEDHESYGEDGESCGHDDHECIRTCRAIQTLYTRRSAALKKAEEVIKTLTIADDRHFDEMSKRGHRAT